MDVGTFPSRILLSGTHSGPNPSPGLSVARSLRAAGFDGLLVALDYGPESSGLHSPLFNERVVLPAWSNAGITAWANTVEGFLDDPQTCYVPGLDLEVRLLDQVLPEHPGVLAPPGKAFPLISKPARAVAAELGVGVPPAELDCTPLRVEQFLRDSPSRRAWVKGQHYEAFPVSTSAEAFAAGRFVTGVWGGAWHLEAHVYGQECGLAFCARDGVLVDMAFMAKSLLTADGKTWAGALEEVPADLADGLGRIASMSGWTGGGEIELIRTWDGELLVLELNPRFPAWIHGATVAGRNLPAALLLGQRVRLEDAGCAAFTRVVEEIPVRPELGHTPFRWSADGALIEATKHPSGVRALARLRFAGTKPEGPSRTAAASDLSWFEALPLPVDIAHLQTPVRVALEPAFRAAVAELQDDLRTGGLLDRCSLAYSVKTCPDPGFMATAAVLGLLPEAITQDELDAAGEAGMTTSTAILNGPAKWWPDREAVVCQAFFADSVAELTALSEALAAGFRLSAEVVGIRLAPRDVGSRFGIRVEGAAEAARVTAAIKPLRDRLAAGWGAHFHLAPSTIGEQAWRAEVERFLDVVDLLSTRLGPPDLIDLGGGWHPSARRRMVPTIVAALGSRVLAPITRLVLEPGKALVEDAGVVLTRVLGRREEDTTVDLVVDAALAELPEALYRAHPVAHLQGGRWRLLGGGDGRLLGRSCMEADILGTQLDLDGLAVGDRLAFLGAGGYDYAMRYDFGRGCASGPTRA